MAHSPAVKRKWVTKLLTEEISLCEVARQSGIAKSVLKTWVVEATKKVGPTVPKKVVNRYIESLEKMVCATMEMVVAQAAMLSDLDYLKGRKSEEIVQLSEFVTKSTRSLLEFELKRAMAERQHALSASSEIVRAEIVDE